MPDIQPQTRPCAIITGSSRGIGAACAERLAKDGFAVVVNYSSDAEAAEKLVTQIRSNGAIAMSFKADVADAKAVTAMFDAATEAFGGVDVLVNNAGIMKLAPLADTDDALFDKHISINLKGVFNGMREAANRLRDGGRIISFSSSVVGLCQPTYGVYSATKAAVEALTHTLAKELGKRNITVNAVAPGPVATELFLDGKPSELIGQITKMIPLARLGTPDDIAQVVSFLAGPDAGWINGQVIRANGGMV